MLPNALVLVMDRLGSAYLGPYGNTWIETPAWNRLAARSTLFETAMIDSPDLLQLYRSYWYGQHSIAGEDPNCAGPSLVKALADKSVESWLITDERLVSEPTESHDFDHRVILPPGDGEQAETIEETQLARIYATVLEVLQQAKPPFLIWVHAQAMQSHWDAPYSCRAQFAEEDDPDPPSFTEPPELQLDVDFDPDLLLGMQHAYAGQVSLLDSCLDILLDSIWSSAIGSSTAILATSARGYPIGEHRYVGRTHSPLFGELVHVPWIHHWPESADELQRIHQIVQPPDLFTTLLNWFNIDRPPECWGRSLLASDMNAPVAPDQLVGCCSHKDQRVIRTPGWYARFDKDLDPQLFVKPDDRWEFNEISNRCQQVVELLQTRLTQFATAARAGDRGQIPALEDILLHGGY